LTRTHNGGGKRKAIRGMGDDIRINKVHIRLFFSGLRKSLTKVAHITVLGFVKCHSYLLLQGHFHGDEANVPQWGVAGGGEGGDRKAYGAPPPFELITSS